REVRKLVAEALGEMKKGQPITNNRMVPPGGLQVVPGIGQGWGGPGSSPWMPGAPAAGAGRDQSGPDGEREKKRKSMIPGGEEKREGVERTLPAGREKEQAVKQLEEARKQLEQTLKQARDKNAGGPVQATWSVKPAAEAEEHLTLTRRGGRYVARLIDHGVRI